MGKPRLLASDFFCGCGGSSLGLSQAGYTHVFACDWDKAACASYEANIGLKPWCGDISNLPASEVPDADLFVGSPPCQGFSSAGKREKNDPRNFLVWEFVRLVAAKRPKAFIMENVPSLDQGPNHHLAQLFQWAFESVGYQVTVMKLNCADYGVPQIRRRIFWVGALDFRPQIPPPTHANGGMMGLLPWVTVRQALGIPYDHPSPRVTCSEGHGVHPSDIEGRGARRAGDIALLIRHSGREGTEYGIDQPSGSIRGAHGQPGQEILRIRRVRSENSKANGPIAEVDNSPACTVPGEPMFASWADIPARGGALTEGELMAPGHHDTMSDRVFRRLTIRECLILQGFPPDYKIVGNQSQQYQQVGNAVPPPMMKVIGARLMEVVRLGMRPGLEPEAKTLRKGGGI